MKSFRSMFLGILLLGILVPTIIQNVIFNVSMNNMSHCSQAIVRERVLNEVDEELSYTVQAVISALESNYQENVGKIPEDELVQEILQDLRTTEYGDSGYFFAYQYDGVRVVAPENRAQEGKNLWNLTDQNGKLCVQEFIKAAQSGGDFVSYMWLNPKTGKSEEKRSYVAPLRLGNYEIAVGTGTGTYLPMLEAAQQEVAQEIEGTKSSAIKLIIVVVIITLLLVLLIVYFLINRFLLKPLEELTSSSEIMAAGNLNVNIKEDYFAELGVLGKAMKKMLLNMRSIMVSVNESAEKLNDAIKEISQATRETAQVSEQVAATINQISTGAQETANQTNNIAASSADTANKINSVADSIKLINQSVEEAVAYTQQGGKIVEDLSSGIKETENKSKLVQEAMERLEEQAKQISGITNVIVGIADQTNLLALNAAIEAARAGDAGKGFAVVAEEVRKLAEASNNQASEINKLINEVTKNIEAAVEATGDTAKLVTDQNVIGNDVASKFAQIAAGTNKIATLLKDVEKAVSIVNENGQKVAKAIEDIAATSEENAASAEEIAASTEEMTSSTQTISASTQGLVALMEKLKEETQRFTL